jgi:hypothetical protein
MVGAPTPDEEQAAIAALEAALDARRAGLARRRVARWALAASAVLLLGAGAWRLAHREVLVASAQPAPTAPAITAPTAPAPSGALGFAVAGHVVLLHEGAERALEAGAPLEPGDRVVSTTDGRASIALPSGTHVSVEATTDVVVASLGAAQSFTLRSGAVRADVAKLQPGQRFLVRTDDVEVEVRGTSFRVEKADRACAGTTTRVSVSEGRVWVRHAGQESILAAGESWPKGCEAHASVDAPPSPPRSGVASLPAAPSGPTAQTTGVQPSGPMAATPPAPAPTAPSAPVTPASELAAQNRAFAAAMSKKRGGDVAGAVAAFDALLVAWPDGPLAESAEVERMRLLAGAGDARARDAARAYLAKRPAGFARSEAATLAGRP